MAQAAAPVTQRKKKVVAAPGAKVGGAAFASAVAAIFWTIAAGTFWKGTFTDATLAGLTGSTGTAFAFVVGYFLPSA